MGEVINFLCGHGGEDGVDFLLDLFACASEVNDSVQVGFWLSGTGRNHLNGN